MRDAVRYRRLYRRALYRLQKPGCEKRHNYRTCRDPHYVQLCEMLTNAGLRGNDPVNALGELINDWNRLKRERAHEVHR